MRALAVELDAEGRPADCGPRPAQSVAGNSVVIDQRAYALANWRVATAEASPRRLDSIEQLREVNKFVVADERMGVDAAATLARAGTVYAGVGAGREWLHPSRIRGELTAGVSCELQVEDRRWFNEGTTVLITDGISSELGLVRSAGGTIALQDPVVNGYAPFSAVIYPMARRPVNINTASAEVLRALVLHLQLRGRQARISSSEASDLVEVIVESRPFTSFEDFVRRVILPAAGWELLPGDAPVVPEAFRPEPGASNEDPAALAFLDEDDARALYKNALNANDGELSFSTLPFAFVSTDTHRMELRASVNAPSGIERVHAVREQVQLMVPQQDLLYVATRQEDFDRLFRLDRDAPGWSTGPLNTGRFDSTFRSSPPTRSRAHLGPRDTMPADDPLTDSHDYVFASRDEQEDGFAMPWVARVWEAGTPREGRMLHFDHEQREPEGRYLPEGAIALSSDNSLVEWNGDSGLMLPMSLSMWVKAEELEPGALFLDAGGPYTDSDRISLTLDDGDLVLQVRDAAQDHDATIFEEVGEVRYELTESDESPGMPPDTWMHVEVDVRGNRPDQMALLVDGKWHNRTPGLTRLSGGLSPGEPVIAVESTEGFGEIGEPCVLRIGNELIEAVISGEGSFDALYQTEGQYAWFGGRLARSEFTGIEPGVPTGLAEEDAYAEGTPVQNYGYSLPIASNISNGSGSLASDAGLFRVARVVGMENPETISVPTLFFSLGTGLDTAQTAVLDLVSADDVDDAEFMEAFDPNGGYAVMMTVRVRVGAQGQGAEEATSSAAPFHRIGGAEIVHYSGWSDTQLFIDRRGEQLNLPNQQEAPDWMAGSGAFVFNWADGWTEAGSGIPLQNLMTWQTKIFPISLRVSGANSFDQASSDDPKVVQITDLDNPELTEWVRYDYNTGTDLIRDDPLALSDAYFAVQAGVTESDGEGTDPTGGSGGVGGPGGGGGGGFFVAPSAAPPAPQPEPLDDGYWHYRIGEEEEEAKEHLVSRSVRSYFQFRGVFGTSIHRHDAGTLVLPVFQTPEGGLNLGLPGRFDPVTMIDADPSDPGWQGRIHFSHRPTENTVYHWQQDPGGGMFGAEGDPPATREIYPAVMRNRVHVGLQEAAAIPFAAGAAVATDDPIYDSRILARISKFPSGEMPRGVSSVALGGGYGGGGAVPAATVDEIAFGTSDFALGQDTWGAQMVVEQPFSGDDDSFEVLANTIRLAVNNVGFTNGEFLGRMPEDAGLLRIGDEILCYEGYDESAGVVSVAPGGRGLLGTDEGAHARGEGVTLLEHIPVSVLASGIGSEDAQIELTSVEDFPAQGLVLIENELIHYTWIDGATLGMPAASSEPGAMDGEGAGLFRGRFGTEPESHAAGTPVVLFPFRYWDRWADEADAPELHYMGFSLSQPNAFWRTVFWDVEEPGIAGPQLGVLQRTSDEVPWDTEPGAQRDLEVLWEGLRDGEGNPIGVQADRIEWRVFVRYEPGSFDPEFGLLHGWKTTPQLKFFGAEYMGPGMVLRRVAR